MPSHHFTHNDTLQDLQRIPGVGSSIVVDLGIGGVNALRGPDPETFFRCLCAQTGRLVDRCLLYVFCCAVFLANQNANQGTSYTRHGPYKFKRWYWKDGT